jgi:hypothetical protein
MEEQMAEEASKRKKFSCMTFLLVILSLSVAACLGLTLFGGSLTEDFEREQKALAPVLAELRAEQRERCAPLLKNFVADVDEVEEIKRWRPAKAPKFMNSRTTLHGALTSDLEDQVTSVWLVANYAGDDWVLFDRLIAKTDAVKLEFSASPERDNAGGTVGEITRFAVHSDANDFAPEWVLASHLRSMATGDVIVRFQGKRSHDHRLLQWEQQSLADAACFADVPTMADARARQEEREGAAEVKPDM